MKQLSFADESAEYQEFVEKFKSKKTTDECAFIRALDHQRGTGKGLYGSGLLVSEKAAARKAAVRKREVNIRTLLEREKEIIKRLK